MYTYIRVRAHVSSSSKRERMYRRCDFTCNKCDFTHTRWTKLTDHLAGVHQMNAKTR